MAAVVRVIRLNGFDSGGEPSVREMSDGSLEVSFEFMPPSDVERSGPSGLGEFATFDKEMSAAIGIPVVWEDRELFVIERTAPDTLERLRRFIEGYRAAR